MQSKPLMLSLVLCLTATLLSLCVSVAAQSCSDYVLDKTARLKAIESGIAFTAVATPASTFGFDLCLSIGGGGGFETDASLGFSKAVGAQLDSGSTGVVVPRPTLPTGSYRPSGVCHVFDLESSFNSYFGEMVFAHVRLFGNDSDGRYLETNPMPILAVEYKCTGAACVPALAQYNESCSAIRAVMPLPGWVATNVNSTTALVGVGMNRGDPLENYPIGPVPISRNPMVQLNLDPLADIVPWYNYDFFGTVPVSSLCKTDLSATSHWSNSGRYCIADPAEQYFKLNQANLVAYGYLLSATAIMPLYTYPYAYDEYSATPSPLTNPIFSCQTLPQLKPAANTPAQFKCWDTTGLYQKVEIFSVNSSVLTSSSAATWTGEGSLLADTGLAYFIDNTPSYPCLSSVTAVKMSFPIPGPNSTQTTTPHTFTFDVDWRAPTGSGTAVYYPTLQAQVTPAQYPPTKFRLWQFNTSAPCQNVHTVQSTGLSNSGRFLYNSFVLYADFINGVQGYASAPDFTAAFKGHY